jgi:prevent-host-death family protein
MRIECEAGRMLNIEEDIDSLTSFKRNSADFLKRLKDSGRPLVLTVNGKAEVVVQDAGSYQRLVERAEMAEFLSRSRADADAGRTVPFADAVKKLGGRRK